MREKVVRAKVVFERDGLTCSVDVTKCHACQSCHAKPKVDVARCHTCHAKRRWMSPSATPAYPKCRCMSPSATPATQSEGPCHRVPRLPRKVPAHVAKCHACHPNKCHACHANGCGENGVHWEPSGPREPAQCHKCQACHAKCTSMSPSATPATQSEGQYRQVPRLLRQQPQGQRRQPGNKRATRASRARPCHQVPCRRQAPAAGTKRATRASPVP